VGGAVILFALAITNERLTRKEMEMANIINNFSMDFVNTALRNAEVVQGMGMYSGVVKRWAMLHNKMLAHQLRGSRRASLFQSIIRTFRMSMQVLVYCVGAYLTLKGKSTAGVMITASIIMGRALAPIEIAVNSWRFFVDARSAYKRLDRFFASYKPMPRMEMPAPEGMLKVEAVSLAMQGRYVLRNINFALEPGQALGLIGPSAAGKSSLCRVIMGVWVPSAGHVRLDGVDIQTWEKDKLGQYLGYLPQDVELFAGTVAENIARLGDVDSEKVIAAAKLAGVHEMILKFPQGYDTQIGEIGSSLSGGQRQRIGLARAVYGMPRLVVLDEPNSNLDDEGERYLLAALRTLKENGVTTVVVSHRPSLLTYVDKILVLRQGQIAMFGPRDEVLQKLVPQPKPQVQRPAQVRKVR
jgi:PrtD family type I secretion system ABC transporter